MHLSRRNFLSGTAAVTLSAASSYAQHSQSWMGTSIPYCEGPVRNHGSHDGVGYLEMTGY